MDAHEIIENAPEEHIRSRTEMWGGSIRPTKHTVPAMSEPNGEYEFKSLIYSDCMYTCINELLANCYDHALRCSRMSYLYFDVDVTNDTITTRNDGTGIDADKICTAFGRAFTGSRSTIGQKKTAGISGHSGIGAKLTNMCSREFLVYSTRAGVECHVKFVPPKYIGQQIHRSKTKKDDNTIIVFRPDRDGRVKFVDDLQVMAEIFCARCRHIKWMLPHIAVHFNGVLLNDLPPENLFPDSFVARFRLLDGLSSSAYLFINKDKIAPRLPTKYVIVNGMDARHMYKKRELWACAAAGIKSLSRGAESKTLYKSICDNLQSDKINNCIYLLFILSLSDPIWTSNQKIDITNPPAILELLPMPEFFVALFDGVKDWLSTITDKTNRSVVEKHFAPAIGQSSGRERTLIITEGKSADSIVRTAINETGNAARFGRFILFGKPENILKTQRDPERIVNGKFFKSDRMKAFLRATGLSVGVQPNVRKLPYQRFLIATDQDEDGDHIAGLLTMAFYFTWPVLFAESAIYKSCMPLVIATSAADARAVKIFSSKHDMTREISDAELVRYHVRYYKGLGQYPRRWQLAMISDERFHTIVRVSDETKKLFIKYFDENNVLDRRAMLMEKYVMSRASHFDIGELCIDEFLRNNLINFFQANILRHLPSLYDGLNDSQRRVLYTIYHDAPRVINLVSLSGRVKGTASYEHGDAAIQKVLVSMARSYDGHCYIPLLRMRSAGFGSRNLPDDESCPRYLDCMPNNLIKLIFPADDLAFLDRDESNVPYSYCGTIPLVVLNYNKQPASAWSVNIIPRDFTDVIAIIRKMIRGKKVHNTYVRPANDYTPKRTVELSKDGHTEIFRGSYVVDNNKFIVDELPPFTYGDRLRDKLNEMSDMFGGNVINVSGSYSGIHIAGTFTGEGAEDKLRGLLARTYRPQLNIIADHARCGVVAYESFMAVIVGWFAKRKSLFARVYARDKTMLELQIAKENFIKTFVDRLEDINIMRDSALLEAYIADLQLPKISNKTMVNRTTYTDPDVLNRDWYNAPDASHEYLTRNTIADIAAKKHEERLIRLRATYGELIEQQQKPFPYAHKWLTLIDGIEKMYADNVHNNWLELEDR